MELEVTYPVFLFAFAWLTTIAFRESGRKKVKILQINFAFTQFAIVCRWGCFCCLLLLLG